MAGVHSDHFRNLHASSGSLLSTEAEGLIGALLLALITQRPFPMPYDPVQPAEHSELKSEVVCAQFVGLKELTDVAPGVIVAPVVAVTMLAQKCSVKPARTSKGSAGWMTVPVTPDADSPLIREG